MRTKKLDYFQLSLNGKWQGYRELGSAQKLFFGGWSVIIKIFIFKNFQNLTFLLRHAVFLQNLLCRALPNNDSGVSM